jgi:hypothetical protein
MDPTKEQRQILCKSQKKRYGVPVSDYTSVRGRKHEPYTESTNSPRPKKGETGEEHSQEHAYQFPWLGWD